MAAHRFWLLILMALAGCGGGGSSSSSMATGWVAGMFAPSASFAGQCTTALGQNNFLRSWTNETYLWYDEVVDRDPALSTTPAYFDLLKTMALTPSGNAKDRFHFTIDTATWNAFSQSGVSAGYGAELVVVSSLPPRRVVVGYTEPGSPATAASLARGAEILTADGVDVVNTTSSSGIDTLNNALFPDAAGETHTFTVRDIGGGTRTVTMQTANVTETPVQNVVVLPGPVGYLLFNDHIATAEPALVTAISTLKNANITDLVLDIRYNGGGLLGIAGELAYMIAGGTRTAGKTFEQIVMNAKLGALPPLSFPTTTLGFSGAAGQPLPTLNLSRVFVLTGSGTCSASESIINSLNGIGVTVIQIGSTTCGKPYGFDPQDNCGTTYFSIQFKGINNAGFGDYTDGFSPQNTLGTAGTRIPGCSVGDDFSHALGDPAEARLAAALAYRLSPGSCPTPTGFAPSPGLRTSVRATLASPGVEVKGRAPWRENRLLRPQ